MLYHILYNVYIIYCTVYYILYIHYIIAVQRICNKLQTVMQLKNNNLFYKYLLLWTTVKYTFSAITKVHKKLDIALQILPALCTVQNMSDFPVEYLQNIKRNY